MLEVMNHSSRKLNSIQNQKQQVIFSVRWTYQQTIGIRQSVTIHGKRQRAHTKLARYNLLAYTCTRKFSLDRCRSHRDCSIYVHETDVMSISNNLRRKPGSVENVSRNPSM